MLAKAMLLNSMLLSSKGDGSGFISSGITALSYVVMAVGGGLLVLGIIGLLEGYGNDNPGANAHVR